MSYEVIFTKQAEKSFRKVPTNYKNRILLELEKLSDSPYSHTSVKKMEGQDGYRLRVGPYRVIYQIEDAELIIEVVRVGSRGDIYKG